ncbi:COG4223 family protein [Sinorhizobium prairiense]|uniref:COG4223 family protein n=1 Tax=unclassified Sinorhizobium TaxID=2613772 RepID=UPI0023D7D90C|nr:MULTISPECIES: COG4223 family protein [unclassified Sinorhizobium]WEJ09934.1 COG4223 family protein [Sinorhizobium sp. M103]WEJ15516.1 COG4223 family protein [Sinorhizobium sp. K101]WEJ36897.1 COG4223 family protein [Sinorhizobium sp. C101]
MASEKPPRRSKPGKEPLTIDLEAEKTEPAAGEAAAGPDAAPGEPADISTSEAAEAGEVRTGEVESNEAGIGEPPLPAGDPQEEAETEEARADAAAAAFDAELPHATNGELPEAKRRQATGAGALAAGILGGLIALAGAGVLQYAGYVPAPGPEQPGTEQNLASEIEAIKAELQAQAPAATVDVAPLENRLAALEQAAREPGAAAADAPEIKALEAEVANLTNEMADLKTELAEARQAADAARAELAGRIDQAEQKLNEPANDIEMAKAVAVTALKTAIDRGGPFLAELDALRSIAPEDPVVKELADVAATGVPTRTELRESFRPAADAMLDALHRPDPDQGIFDRLVSSAMSGIRVRPVGSVEGDTPEAVIARIEDKLDNGDLKGASLEWDSLPEAAKSAGQGFKEKLDRRLGVETVIDAAVAGTMTRTGKQG